MTHRPSLRRWSFLAVAAVLLMAAGPPGHDFVTIDVPGAVLSFGFGISNQAVVTGLYYDAEGNSHGFVYENGVITTVDGPTSNPALSQAALYNLSKKHWAGAQYIDDSGTFRAAVYNIDTQTWNTLPVIPGTGYNAAGGVNSQGVSAGNWTTDPTTATGNQGWTFDPKTGSYSFFDVPGVDKVHYIGTIVNDINNAGVVVGLFSDGNGVNHGFAKNGDQYQTIDVPGADLTAIQGINSEGDVSGVYRAAGVRHGFVLTRNGKLITIDVPGVDNTALFGVSDNGNVAGYYRTPDGVFHGFFALKAVPRAGLASESTRLARRPRTRDRISPLRPARTEAIETCCATPPNGNSGPHPRNVMAWVSCNTRVTKRLSIPPPSARLGVCSESPIGAA